MLPSPRFVMPILSTVTVASMLLLQTPKSADTKWQRHMSQLAPCCAKRVDEGACVKIDSLELYHP